MDNSYWFRQEDSQPLFPDILWSRPENKQGAGKLLIIGGNAHGFNAPAIAYQSAMEAGAGVCRVIMPDHVKKVVKGLLPDADFAASTPSGSFSKKALADLLDHARWADTVLLAGDIGRNSETAIALETFTEKFNSLLVVTQDAVDYFKETPQQLIDRHNTAIVLSLAQLQKIFINTPSITPIVFSMNTLQLVNALHEFTSEHAATFVVQHNSLLFVASNGKVTTTKDDRITWRVATAARSSVFWLQNPKKPFEAITTSLISDN